MLLSFAQNKSQFTIIFWLQAVSRKWANWGQVLGKCLVFTYSKLAASSLGIQPLRLQAGNTKGKDENINKKTSFVSSTKQRRNEAAFVSFSPALFFLSMLEKKNFHLHCLSLSIHLSTWIHTEWIFMNSHIWVFLNNLSRKFKFH